MIKDQNRLPPTKKAPKEKEHYVNNKLFYTHMLKYVTEYKDCKDSGKQLPRLSDFAGEAILKIATRISYKFNFIKYSYREEMVGDAVENCIKYAHNFNPEKSKNPFAYFSQIAYNAFLHRIATEHKETYVKYKLFENSDILSEIMDMVEPNQPSKAKQNSDFKEKMDDFIKNFEEKKLKSKPKTPRKRGIEEFLEESTNV